MRTRLAGAITLILATGPALSADWSVTPVVTASFEYNDNTRMTQNSQDAIDVTGGAIDAALELRADRPRGYFSLRPRARSTFFPGDETEETDSQYVRLNLSERWERAQFDLRSDYSRIETLGSYLPGGIGDPGGPIGVPDPGVGTGGRAEAPNREDRFLIAPSLSYSLSERHGLVLGGGFVDTQFKERVDQDREDFSYLYGWAGYVYRLSPAKSLRFSVEAARFEDEDGVTTGSRGLSAEWRNEVSETSEIYARVGAAQNEDDASALDPEWETGFSGGFGVRWTMEVSKVLVDLTTDLDPNSTGRLVQRDQFRLQFERRLTERLDFITGARAVRDAGTDSDEDFEEREFVNASLGLAWRLARDWRLGGTYTYSWREYENDESSADANRISIGITYQPDRR